MRRKLVWACVMGAVSGAVMYGSPAAAAPLPTVAPVVLPADHGAHPGFRVEWWYTAGTATGMNGRDYFWFATVWAGAGRLVAKVNIVDLQADQVVLANEYTGPDELTVGQTDIHVGGLRMMLDQGTGDWSVEAPVPDGSQLQLTLNPVQPYVLNGVAGITRQGRRALSDYYSDPRLSVVGTLGLGGDSVALAGVGWFDHQWGNFAFDPSALHWNWFACQFDDGSDLMLYQFITRGGEPTGTQTATYVTAGGVSHPRDFEAIPLGQAIVPPGATGAYPLRWRLQVPSAHLALTLDSLARSQFISNTIVPSFWEGAAAITNGPAGHCIVESTRESIFSGL